MTPPSPFRVDPSSPVPIWAQIEEGMRRLLATGELGPLDAVPSVRDLATRLRVNPATVAKGYQRLTEQGVLEVRRGEGTFVSAAPATFTRADRARRLREAAEQYQTAVMTLGASLAEAAEELETVWSSVRTRATKAAR